MFRTKLNLYCKKPSPEQLGMMGHIYNPNYLGGGGRMVKARQDKIRAKNERAGTQLK
jgi:hypothetical protein